MMIKSMTGYASLTRDDEAAAISVTVKGVNHRFLDLQLHTPTAIAPLESRLRAIVQQRVARGRIEVTVSLQPRKPPGVDVDVNDSVIEGLASALERARERGLVTGSLAPGDILRFPQAVTIRERQDDSGSGDQLYAAVESALVDALDELDRMRVREGAHLRTDLDARRAQIADLFERAAGRAGPRAR